MTISMGDMKIRAYYIEIFKKTKYTPSPIMLPFVSVVVLGLHSKVLKTSPHSKCRTTLKVLKTSLHSKCRTVRLHSMYSKLVYTQSVRLLVSQFILPPGQLAPQGLSQPRLACPPGGNLSRDILPPALVIFTPGGQAVQAGLSCPPPPPPPI